MIALPPLTLSAFCYALGYGTGLAAFYWMAQRRKLATSGILTVMFAGLLGGLAGANLGQWLVAGSTGKSVLGGIVGGYLSVFAAKHYLGIRRPTGDLFAVALSAGEAVGRFGCYFGGCCYGKPSDVPWGIWQHGEYRHPTQLYLAATNAIILFVLVRVEKTNPPENTLFCLQGQLYCIARFVIEFFRETPGTTWGLTSAQWACIGGLIFYSLRFLMLLRQSRSPQLLSQTTAA